MPRAIPILFLFFLLLCPALPWAGSAPPLVLRSNTESVPLSGHIDILEDKTGRLTIGEVSSPGMNGMFKPHGGTAPSLGISKSVYWTRFTIEKDTGAEKSWLLELDNPNIGYLDLYAPVEGGGFERMQAGAMRPMSIRKFMHRNPVFPVDIDGPGSTFFLRTGGNSRKVFPLTVWSREAFSHMDHRRGLLAGCYFGAILVMSAYHFFVFLSLRDRNYLYYILDIFSLGLYEFVVKGFVIEFFTAEIPSINQYTFALGAVAVFAGLLFARSFLAIERNAPLLDRLMKILMFAVVLFIPLIFFLPAAGCKVTLVVAALCSSIIGISAGVVCLRRGFRPARYYLGARIFRAAGVLIFVLGAFSILPRSFLTQYCLQMGSIIEVVFLSFALADRINVMRREKEEAEADAIRSSHLAALGELAAGVAHEINTPVNTIINSADLLLEDGDRKSMEHDVAVIKDQGRRIATIAKSLLFFARREEKEKVPFAVSDLLQGTLDMIGAKLRKEHIKLTVQIPPGLMAVMVYPQQIEQVFLNILTNAMHALDERHGSAQDSKTFEIDASELFINNRPYVRVAFSDNGIGIPVSLLDTVRESFVTTKKSGTGLGLSISQQIIDRHGGAIGIESRVGEYTRVNIDLPGAFVPSPSGPIGPKGEGIHKEP